MPWIYYRHADSRWHSWKCGNDSFKCGNDSFKCGHDWFTCVMTHSTAEMTHWSVDMTHSNADMTDSHVPWLIHMCHDSFTCAITHLYVETMCAMSHSYVPWNYYQHGCPHHTCYRVATRHRIPYLYRSLSAKELYNYWFFSGKRIATQGILCVFATLYHQYVNVSCHVAHMNASWHVAHCRCVSVPSLWLRMYATWHDSSM